MSYTPQEISDIEHAYQTMLEDINPFVNAPDHLALIDKAYHYCLEKCDGRYLISGKIYMMHLIDMARIAVLEVGLGYISVVASFLHSMVSDIRYQEDVAMGEDWLYLFEAFSKAS